MIDYNTCKSWVIREAITLAAHAEETNRTLVTFETGYGPSGLPHIGTFGEVARTSMVRHAFEQISNIPTRLTAFSDDMDGLRKVPDNIPNPDIIAPHLGKPLTQVPDPFGTHESFAQHNNARLCTFLDQFGFDYHFKSATETYQSGEFDDALLAILHNYEKIQAIMLPTLGDERRATYSPFMPICPDTGKVLAAPVLEVKPADGTIIYENEAGNKIETPVTGGACKLQWKPDWGMRWAALGVDYEMHGKDLTPSASLSSRICKTIGYTPPHTYVYELFLDEKGEKISKSKGNGLSIEEWLTYGTQESLSLYMYNTPHKAKRLYFDVIPKHVDEYITWLGKYSEQSPQLQADNPAWHIHHGNPPQAKMEGLSFNLLLNLVSVANTEDLSVLWGFISRYAPGATADTHPLLNQLASYALKYYRDFVKPTKQYRTPSEAERAALAELKTTIANLPLNADAEQIQTDIFTVGKNHNYENLREWFKALYEILLGSEQGPRMGSFVQLYGHTETIELIDKALNNENLAA